MPDPTRRKDLVITDLGGGPDGSSPRIYDADGNEQVLGRYGVWFLPNPRIRMGKPHVVDVDEDLAVLQNRYAKRLIQTEPVHIGRVKWIP